MSKEQITEATSTAYYVAVTAITTGGIGAFLFEILGASILAIIGAGIGWAFKRFVVPYLDKLFPPKK